MAGVRHKWQSLGAPGASKCTVCGIIREYEKQIATYKLQNGSIALYAPKCDPPEKQAGGLHKCPADGRQCWCIADKPECLAKLPGIESNPNQLTLF